MAQLSQLDRAKRAKMVARYKNINKSQNNNYAAATNTNTNVVVQRLSSGSSSSSSSSSTMEERDDVENVNIADSDNENRNSANTEAVTTSTPSKGIAVKKVDDPITQSRSPMKTPPPPHSSISPMKVGSAKERLVSMSAAKKKLAASRRASTSSKAKTKKTEIPSMTSAAASESKEEEAVDEKTEEVVKISSSSESSNSLRRSDQLARLRRVRANSPAPTSSTTSSTVDTSCDKTTHTPVANDSQQTEKSNNGNNRNSMPPSSSRSKDISTMKSQRERFMRMKAITQPKKTSTPPKKEVVSTNASLPPQPMSSPATFQTTPKLANNSSSGGSINGYISSPDNTENYVIDHDPPLQSLSSVSESTMGLKREYMLSRAREYRLSQGGNCSNENIYKNEEQEQQELDLAMDNMPTRYSSDSTSTQDLGGIDTTAFEEVREDLAIQLRHSSGGGGNQSVVSDPPLLQNELTISASSSGEDSTVQLGLLKSESDDGTVQLGLLNDVVINDDAKKEASRQEFNEEVDMDDNIEKVESFPDTPKSSEIINAFKNNDTIKSFMNMSGSRREEDDNDGFPDDSSFPGQDDDKFEEGFLTGDDDGWPELASFSQPSWGSQSEVWTTFSGEGGQQGLVHPTISGISGNGIVRNSSSNLGSVKVKNKKSKDPEEECWDANNFDTSKFTTTDDERRDDVVTRRGMEVQRSYSIEIKDPSLSGTHTFESMIEEGASTNMKEAEVPPNEQFSVLDGKSSECDSAIYEGFGTVLAAGSDDNDWVSDNQEINANVSGYTTDTATEFDPVSMFGDCEDVSPNIENADNIAVVAAEESNHSKSIASWATHSQPKPSEEDSKSISFQSLKSGSLIKNPIPLQPGVTGTPATKALVPDSPAGTESLESWWQSRYASTQHQDINSAVQEVLSKRVTPSQDQAADEVTNMASDKKKEGTLAGDSFDTKNVEGLLSSKIDGKNQKKHQASSPADDEDSVFSGLDADESSAIHKNKQPPAKSAQSITKSETDEDIFSGISKSFSISRQSNSQFRLKETTSIKSQSLLNSLASEVGKTTKPPKMNAAQEHKENTPLIKPVPREKPTLTTTGLFLHDKGYGVIDLQAEKSPTNDSITSDITSSVIDYDGGGPKKTTFRMSSTMDINQKLSAIADSSQEEEDNEEKLDARNTKSHHVPSSSFAEIGASRGVSLMNRSTIDTSSYPSNPPSDLNSNVPKSRCGIELNNMEGSKTCANNNPVSGAINKAKSTFLSQFACVGAFSSSSFAYCASDTATKGATPATTGVPLAATQLNENVSPIIIDEKQQHQINDLPPSKDNADDKAVEMYVQANKVEVLGGQVEAIAEAGVPKSDVPKSDITLALEADAELSQPEPPTPRTVITEGGESQFITEPGTVYSQTESTSESDDEKDSVASENDVVLLPSHGGEGVETSAMLAPQDAIKRFHSAMNPMTQLMATLWNPSSTSDSNTEEGSSSGESHTVLSEGVSVSLEQSNLAILMAKLSKEGIEVLKLNREKKWQQRFLLVTKDVMHFPKSNDNRFMSFGQCPAGLLWLKNMNNAHTTAGVLQSSTIDKNGGKGGILFTDIQGVSVTNDKYTLSRKQKKGKFKNSITFVLHASNTTSGEKRDIMFRCMSKEDAFVLSYGFQAILDRIKAKEETNQNNQERAQTILNRIERILDAPGGGNNRRQLKTMTADTNLVMTHNPLQDTPLSSTKASPLSPHSQFSLWTGDVSSTEPSVEEKWEL